MSDQPATLVTQRLRWFQNHRVFSLLIVIGIILIAIAALTDALGKLWKFAMLGTPPSVSTSRSVPHTEPSDAPTPVFTPKPVALAAAPELSPTPTEAERIVSELRAARPLQRQKIAQAYLNIPVDWKLYFSTGEMHERLTTLQFDSSVNHRGMGDVIVQIVTKDHEDLALLEIGTPMRVRGRIEMVNDSYVALKDAEVER